MTRSTLAVPVTYQQSTGPFGGPRTLEIYVGRRCVACLARHQHNDAWVAPYGRYSGSDAQAVEAVLLDLGWLGAQHDR